MTAPAVTTSLYAHGAVDEAAFAKFVAKMERFYRKCMAKGAADMRSMYYGWTEADCVEAARAYCGCYRHHYRVLVQIDPATRQPLASL